MSSLRGQYFLLNYANTVGISTVIFITYLQFAITKREMGVVATEIRTQLEDSGRGVQGQGSMLSTDGHTDQAPWRQHLIGTGAHMQQICTIQTWGAAQSHLIGKTQ